MSYITQACIIGFSSVGMLKMLKGPIADAVAAAQPLIFMCVCDMQAFDKGPWPKMTGCDRRNILMKFAQLIDVSVP